MIYNKIGKKTVSVLVMAVLLMGNVQLVYADTATVSTSATLKTVLSFEDCLDIALKSNVELQTLDSRIILAQRELAQAQVDASNVQLDRSKSESVYLEEGRKLELYPAIKEKAIKDLQDSRLDILKDIKKDLMVAYIDVFNTENTVKNQQNSLALIEKEYAAKKTEYNAGKSTKQALMEYEVNVEEAKIQLEKVKRDLELSKIEVNRQIGYPLDTQITLSAKPSIEPVELKIDLNALIAKAKTGSKSVIDAKYNYDSAVKEMEVINRYTLFNRTSSYETLEKKLPDYKKALSQATIQAGLTVKTDWMALQNALYDIKIAELKLNIAKGNYEVEKAKFAVGKSTAINVTKAANEVNSKESSLNDSKVSYYKLRINFEDFMSRLK